MPKQGHRKGPPAEKTCSPWIAEVVFVVVRVLVLVLVLLVLVLVLVLLVLVLVLVLAAGGRWLVACGWWLVAGGGGGGGRRRQPRNCTGLNKYRCYAPACLVYILLGKSVLKPRCG